MDLDRTQTYRIIVTKRWLRKPKPDLISSPLQCRRKTIVWYCHRMKILPQQTKPTFIYSTMPSILIFPARHVAGRMRERKLNTIINFIENILLKHALWYINTYVQHIHTYMHTYIHCIRTYSIHTEQVKHNITKVTCKMLTCYINIICMVKSCVFQNHDIIVIVL